MNDEILSTVVVICLIIGILFLPFAVDGLICSSKAEKKGLQYDYGITQGCMVKYNGKWIDYDRLRYTEK